MTTPDASPESAEEPADKAAATAGTAVPEPVREEPSRAIAVALPQKLARYARGARKWRTGCEVTVLRDGAETYPAMLDAIASAQHSISLETYILAADAVGNRFKRALDERARAGVKVRLIYDAVGSFGLSSGWVDQLRASGCEVIDFNPIAPWRRRFRLSHRDHRKVLVVDDRVAFTGGINIARDYAALDEGGKGWHDMHCRVTGPIVHDLSRMFRRTWLRAGGTPYRAATPGDAVPRGDGGAIVRLLDNTRLRHRGVVRRAYLFVINAARTSVLIQNAYFLPERGVRRALARAVKRGVDVRVMVPGRSDIRMVEWAGLYVLRYLARRGVKVLRWGGPMLHAKTATIDGTWATIGSYNFDAQSRWSNLEVNIEILDPQIGQELATQFDRDLERCVVYDERAWRDLPWWTKVLAWLSHRVRRFL